jgi:hypothetical protein
MAPRDREVVFADKLFEIRILQHLLRMRAQPQAVITGLDPVIHVLLSRLGGKGVDGRVV